MITDAMEPTIVYPARRVRTMDPAAPTAEAVAIRGDRFRAVGSVEELLQYPHAVLDERYADAVLLPGFVEAHSHAGTGNVWKGTYVGYVDRVDPHGTHWPGCTSIEDVISRLAAADAALEDAEAPLIAWGLDPIYFQHEKLVRAHLDRVSLTRPIAVNHASGHALTVNSTALQRCGVDEDVRTEGVSRDAAGELTGELHEFAAMGLVNAVAGGNDLLSIDADALRNFGQDGVNTGTTTLTDLGSRLLMDDAGTQLYQQTVTGDFPARLEVFHFGAGVGAVSQTLAADAQRLQELKASSTPLLGFGSVKLMLDGTLQGFTARVRQPGYYGDEPNGIWNVSPEEFHRAFEAFHTAGLLIHVHCNGDQATELFLNTLERVLIDHPRPDHRHTCTHSQMSTPAQYRRMKALGACANIFANHIHQWGDQHLDLTMGPDRARRNNAAATAQRLGVPSSLHSDSPVTPLGPLRTVMHAVTRRTLSGRVMGEHERIDAAAALAAVTIGSAYMLKRDAEIGSIEPGKFADLAVLAEDPLAVEPAQIGAIRVHGTVVGGRHFASNVKAGT
ncbi:amidohydrolase [Brevibacterium luteolum]|uniref:amidohydrolase n=1 Tax=Brevibacterium luteolum TaxID=199591 RepID=UPI00223AEA54|nr:amidohydrolase [Brevibacterium luteolum]MCT1828962.1 amidohydrolase [Brevibacterium luteolum]